MKMQANGGYHVSRPMTVRAVARIQSATAIQNGGFTPKGSFAARAARAAALNGGIVTAGTERK